MSLLELTKQQKQRLNLLYDKNVQYIDSYTAKITVCDKNGKELFSIFNSDGISKDLYKTYREYNIAFAFCKTITNEIHIVNLFGIFKTDLTEIVSCQCIDGLALVNDEEQIQYLMNAKGEIKQIESDNYYGKLGYIGNAQYGLIRYRYNQVTVYAKMDVIDIFLNSIKTDISLDKQFTAEYGVNMIDVLCDKHTKSVRLNKPI